MNKFFYNIIILFCISCFLFSCGNKSNKGYNASYAKSLNDIDLINQFLNKDNDKVYKVRILNEECNDYEYYKDTSNELFNLLCTINYGLINDVSNNVSFDKSSIIYKTDSVKYTVYLCESDNLYAVRVGYDVVYNDYNYGVVKYYKITNSDYQKILNEISIIESVCWCEA